MSFCYLCPNLCGVDRKIQKGLCKSGEEISLAYYGVHFYEEPPISGNRGSGTIFFSACTMHCDYCQNQEISRESKGKTVSPRELSEVFRELEDKGVHNINLVTPTHFSDRIRAALDIYRPKIPIVYNTSGYERVEIIKEMKDYVDIYLTDFKYMDAELGEKLSHRKNYPEIALRATEEMISQKSLVYDDKGMLLQGVIVRHLVLPTYIENSIKVIEIYANNFLGKAIISLMSQFTPMEGSPIKRPLKPLEYKIVYKKLLENGITEGFIQEIDSVGKQYIPNFSK